MHVLVVRLVAVVTLLSLAGSTVASAEVVRTTDPAGNGEEGRILDITALRVSSRESAVVTTVSFQRATAGNVGVAYWIRGGHGGRGAFVRIFHRPAGVDRATIRDSTGRVDCPGLAVVWDHVADTVRLRFPSACMEDGDYEDIRVQVIAELGSSDTDVAPKNPDGSWGWTRWVSRG